MRKAMFVLATTLVAMVLASGVALAANRIECRDQDDGRCAGTLRADEMIGTNRAETIRGLGGDDLIKGRGGSDTLDECCQVQAHNSLMRP